MAATYFAPSTAVWAQTPAAVNSLPIGSALTFVADDAVNPNVRPGGEFRAHLRDPLEVGSTLVATAGTTARLVVTSRETAKDGTPRYHIAIVGLNLGLAGRLPVKPDAPVVDHIAVGTLIPATTLASVGYDEGKIRVAIPLPFKLSNEPPNGGYTPVPLRTAAPISPRRRGTPPPTPSPTPLPSASASPAPTASATASAAASAVPSAGPS